MTTTHAVLNITDIPEAADTVRDLLTDVMDDINCDAVSARIETVEFKSRDGFIPYTDGGFTAVLTYDLHSEASSATALIRPIVERDQKECERQWRSDHDLDDAVDIYEDDDFQEFQCAWEQGDPECWFVYVRALFFTADNGRNETGEDEFLFCFGVNDDINYGRDSISWCRGVGTTWY